MSDTDEQDLRKSMERGCLSRLRAVTDAASSQLHRSSESFLQICSPIRSCGKRLVHRQPLLSSLPARAQTKTAPRLSPPRARAFLLVVLLHPASERCGDKPQATKEKGVTWRCRRRKAKMGNGNGGSGTLDWRKEGTTHITASLPGRSGL